MSYEGFERVLCSNGHLSVVDCYNYDYESWRCFCGSGEAWIQSIDQTNGYDPESEFPLEVDQPALVEKCDHCGCSKTIRIETYKIPTPEQMKAFHEKRAEDYERENSRRNGSLDPEDL